MNAKAESLPLLSISAVRKRKPQASRRRDPRGDRYDRCNAFMPGQGVGQSPKLQRCPIEVSTSVDENGRPVLDRKGRPVQVVSRISDPHMVIAVPDPMEPGKRIQTAVNRRVDLLENERAHGNISVSQYEIGRQVQAVFEKASGARIVEDAADEVRVSDPSKRPLVRDQAMIRAVDNAREVKELMDRIERAVGPVGARMLRELLSGAGTFKDYVHARDPLAGTRKVTAMAERFRFLLEALDETFAATGLVVRDKDGNPRIRAETGAAIGEETDERGRLVPAGHGYRWGRVTEPADGEER